MLCILVEQDNEDSLEILMMLLPYRISRSLELRLFNYAIQCGAVAVLRLMLMGLMGPGKWATDVHMAKVIAIKNNNLEALLLLPIDHRRERDVLSSLAEHFNASAIKAWLATKS